MNDNSDRSLSGSWIAARLGIDPLRVEAMRRSGELLAVRPNGAFAWQFPAWQVGADGKLRPEVERVLEAAREWGVPSDRVATVLDRRAGMVAAGGEERRLRDALLEGDVDYVLAEIRRAA